MFYFLAEMLSRLSGLANVVLHELSGDDTDENMRASLEPVSSSVLIKLMRCIFPVLLMTRI